MSAWHLKKWWCVIIETWWTKQLHWLWPLELTGTDLHLYKRHTRQPICDAFFCCFVPFGFVLFRQWCYSLGFLTHFQGRERERTSVCCVNFHFSIFSPLHRMQRLIYLFMFKNFTCNFGECFEFKVEWQLCN